MFHYLWCIARLVRVTFMPMLVLMTSLMGPTLSYVAVRLSGFMRIHSALTVMPLVRVKLLRHVLVLWLEGMDILVGCISLEIGPIRVPI